MVKDMFKKMLEKLSKNRKIAMALFFVIVFAIIGFVLFTKPQPVEAGWWDDSWLYRKAVALTNSGTAQTDFQVMITIDTTGLITAGKMQADCDDIRLTDINSNIIPHWMEPGTCNNASTKIWAKLPSISTTGSTAYIYYGNPSVASSSSTADTFIREISGVQGAWDMDGSGAIATGANVADSSGNGNNGTASNIDTLGMAYASSQYAQGIDFDGTDDYVDISGLAWTPAIFSVEFWIYPLVNSNYNQQVHGTNGWGSFVFHTTSTGSVYVGTDITNRITSTELPAGTVELNKWQHFVFKYDGTTGFFYKNGVFLASKNMDNSIAWGGFRIGQPNTETVNGNIDGVRVYNVVLSQAEITDLYGTGGDRQGYVTTNYVNKSLVRKYSASVSVGAAGAEEKGPGPVGYWSFDEGYGTTSHDETANGNDGTLINGPTWQTEDMCVSGKCLHFDGTDDYIDCGNDSSLDITDAIAISAWVKTDTMVFQTIYSKLAFGVSVPPYLILTNDLKIDWRVPTGTVYNELVSDTTLAVGTWSFVVVTFDSVTGIQNIYIDGVLDKTITRTPYTMKTNANAIVIGMRASDVFFNGFIDEVRIYPYARTAGQIKKDYNAGLAGMGGGTEGVGVAVGGGGSQKWMSDGLVGYWKMDEASWSGVADEVVDASGSGNHGVRAGDATTATGKFGKGGTFDGTGDYVRISDDNSFTGGEEMSAFLWVKRSGDIGNFVRMFAQYDGADLSNRAFRFYINNTSLEYGITIYSDDGSIPVNSTTLSNKTDWHFVGFTFNAGTLRIFVDGSLEGENTGAVTSIRNSSIDLTLGADLSSDNPIHEFPGLIDEARVYNRALSPKEVRDLYNWAPGPVAHWKMDEKVSGNAQTLYDISGNENNGTAYYGANATGMDCSVPGKFGTACEFDGTDDYVYAGNDASLNITEAITISAWVNVGGYPVTFPGIVAKTSDWATLHNGYGFRLSSETSCTGWVGSGVAGTSFSLTLTADAWNFITLTYKSGVGGKLYKNSIEVGTLSNIGNIDPSANALKLGNTYYNKPFDGSIDDVKIYNYARTQKQIIEDMNAGHPAGGSPVGSQVGYWKFDEGFGDAAYDSSPQGNDGDLAGACPGAATCPTWTNSGKFGKALSFDGDDDYINAGNDSSLIFENGMSISAWLKPNLSVDPNSGHIIRRNGNSISNGWYLFRQSTGTFQLQLLDHNAANTSTLGTVDYIIPAGEWIHLVVLTDRNTMKIYIDGTLNVSTDDLTSDPLGSASADAIIGAYNGNANFFNGSIDEVKIYNYALTEDEVRIDYNQGKALVLGASGTESDGATPSFSANREYCVPGDTATCNPPVAEWKMDEKVSGNAQTLYDTSDNANNGTTYYGANLAGMDCSVPGKFGTACEFDGTDDYVDAGNDSSLNFGANSFTLSSWIKSDGFGNSTYQRIFCKDNQSSNLYSIQFTETEPQGRMQIGDGTNSVTSSPTGGASFSDGEWHLMVAVFDRDLDLVTIYRDGIQNGTKIDISSVTGLVNPAVNLSIGRHPSGVQFMDGLIDDMKIYDYARTPAQIAWDYNRGKPVAEWRFDECQGGTAHDESGNGNDGAITIGPTGDQTALGTCTDGLSTSAWNNGETGKINSAMSFDGTDDYIDAGTDSSLNITDALTMEAWFIPSGSSVTNTIIGRSSWTDSFWLFYNATNEVIEVNLEGVLNYSWEATFPKNEWNHVVVTYDKDAGSNNFAIYKNGFLVKQRTLTGSIGLPATSLRIGSTTGTQYNFNGLIDEVKIYNYALAPLQVKTEYNAGAVRFK